MAKARKDFTLSDKIRKQLSELKISIRDTKDETNWEIEK